MAWTEQMVEDLRKMWKEGLTTGEIGKRLGVSKNSIVGKVHRLGLAGRPSPIKKKSDDSEAISQPTAPSLQTIKTSKAEKITSDESNKKAEAVKESKKEEHFISTKIESKPQVRKDGKVMLTSLDNHTCRWPIGDPKDENFHFCGKKVRLGQTYCEEHAALAYVKPNNKK